LPHTYLAGYLARLDRPVPNRYFLRSMGEREVIVGVNEPESTIKAALKRYERRIQSALRVELDGGWDAFVLIGETHKGDVVGHPIGLVILPRGEEPNPRGLLTDDLRAPFLAGAASEIMFEAFSQSYRGSKRTIARHRGEAPGDVEPSAEWLDYLRQAIKNTASLQRPKPRQRTDDDLVANVAVIYLEMCERDRRRVLQLTFEHLRKQGLNGKAWRGLKYGQVRDYVRVARARGYLPPAGRGGVVTCQVTDKLAEWIEAQGKGKKR
jgi:hypothetical protein